VTCGDPELVVPVVVAAATALLKVVVMVVVPTVVVYVEPPLVYVLRIALVSVEVVYDVVLDAVLMVPEEPLELELLLLLALTRAPPIGPVGGEVDKVAFLAKAMNASRVLPVVGALMEPTMPAWQWFFVVCAQ